MMPTPIFIAILDACVLYPAPIRDLLLHLAEVELYQPKWTSIIQKEWVRNLLSNRNDLTQKQLDKTIAAMNLAFPDANVTHFESFIDALTLPDAKDRHVVAAAIKTKANVIVTINLKDFPADYLVQFNTEAQHPDEFISNLIYLNPKKAKQAFDNQVAALKKPPMSKEQVLESLRNCGLVKTVASLKNEATP